MALVYPPLTPLTKDEWDRFSGKGRWDCMVALRGPDCSDALITNLKWVTTSVIRYKLSGVMRVGGMVNERLPFIIMPTSASTAYGTFDINHFLGHIREAAVWLQIPVEGVNFHEWAANGNKRSINGALEHLIPILSKTGQSTAKGVLGIVEGGATCE